MEHGNQKYNFEPLKLIGGSITAKPANLYSLKSAIRSTLKVKTRNNFDFTALKDGQFKVTRIA